MGRPRTGESRGRRGRGAPGGAGGAHRRSRGRPASSMRTACCVPAATSAPWLAVSGGARHRRLTSPLPRRARRRRPDVDGGIDLVAHRLDVLSVLLDGSSIWMALVVEHLVVLLGDQLLRRRLRLLRDAREVGRRAPHPVGRRQRAHRRRHARLVRRARRRPRGEADRREVDGVRRLVFLHLLLLFASFLTTRSMICFCQSGDCL